MEDHSLARVLDLSLPVPRPTQATPPLVATGLSSSSHSQGSCSTPVPYACEAMSPFQLGRDVVYEGVGSHRLEVGTRLRIVQEFGHRCMRPSVVRARRRRRGLFVARDGCASKHRLGVCQLPGPGRLMGIHSRRILDPSLLEPGVYSTRTRRGSPFSHRNRLPPRTWAGALDPTYHRLEPDRTTPGFLSPFPLVVTHSPVINAPSVLARLPNRRRIFGSVSLACPACLSTAAAHYPNEESSTMLVATQGPFLSPLSSL